MLLEGEQMNIFSILVPKQMLTYLNANDPLDHATQFIMTSTYSAVPVIDDEGHYVGIVSEGDFLKAYVTYGSDHLSEHTVQDIVNRDKDGECLNTVGREEILDKILDRNFLCIVDDRMIFIGIITRKSVIMYLNK